MRLTAFLFDPPTRAPYRKAIRQQTTQREEGGRGHNAGRLLDAPVEEWIGGWNVDKKQNTEVEYVAIK